MTKIISSYDARTFLNNKDGNITLKKSLFLIKEKELPFIVKEEHNQIKIFLPGKQIYTIIFTKVTVLNHSGGNNQITTSGHVIVYKRNNKKVYKMYQYTKNWDIEKSLSLDSGKNHLISIDDSTILTLQNKTLVVERGQQVGLIVDNKTIYIIGMT